MHCALPETPHYDNPSIQQMAMWVKNKITSAYKHTVKCTLR